MTVNERIKLAIKWLIGQRIADNQEEVGKLLGYSNKSSFSQVINGRVPLPNDFVERLCSLDRNINKVWITEEKGEMIYPQKTHITNVDIDKASNIKGIPYLLWDMMNFPTIRLIFLITTCTFPLFKIVTVRYRLMDAL